MAKQLVAQCFNIWKKKLLSQLKLDKVQHECYTRGEQGRQVRGVISSRPSEIGYQVPRPTDVCEVFIVRTPDLTDMIIAKLKTWTLYG